jgi:hypothetical protein
MDGQAKALPRHAVTAGGGRAQLLQGARVIGLKTSHSVRSFAHALIETKSSQWLRVALGMLLAGTAYYFGTGPEAIGALVWVAPLPVLIPAFTLGTGQAVVLSLGASLLGGLNMVSYLSGIVPKPLPIPARYCWRGAPPGLLRRPWLCWRSQRHGHPMNMRSP